MLACHRVRAWAAADGTVLTDSDTATRSQAVRASAAAAALADQASRTRVWGAAGTGGVGITAMVVATVMGTVGAMAGDRDGAGVGAAAGDSSMICLDWRSTRRLTR